MWNQILMTIAEKILNFLFKKEEIYKELNNKQQLYLRRWFIVKSKWFRPKVYIHKFYYPDLDRDPHDHPWNSWIFMISGRYQELIYKKTMEGTLIVRRYFRKGPSIRKMSSTTIHTIARLDSTYVWTLFITGPKHREWGFLTPNGWVHWRNYLKI